MPANPNPNNPVMGLSSLLHKPPKPIGTPMNLPQDDQTSPSMGKSIFEGGSDAMLGLLGLGPDTQMNKVGQMAGLASPLIGSLKGLSMVPRLESSVVQTAPTAVEAAELAGQLKGRLGEIPTSRHIVDESGRSLVDDAYTGMNQVSPHPTTGQSKLPYGTHVGHDIDPNGGDSTPMFQVNGGDFNGSRQSIHELIKNGIQIHGGITPQTPVKIR